MGWSFRKSKRFGPFRIGVSRSGLTVGAKLGPASVSRSTSGRESVSVGAKGARWTKSRRRPDASQEG